MTAAQHGPGVHPASPLLSHSWSSDAPYCRVLTDSGTYVECACSHLSVYAASAEFATLASYNEAFYASGIICISGINHVPPISSSSRSCFQALLVFLSPGESDWLVCSCEC